MRADLAATNALYPKAQLCAGWAERQALGQAWGGAYRSGLRNLSGRGGHVPAVPQGARAIWSKWQRADAQGAEADQEPWDGASPGFPLPTLPTLPLAAADCARVRVSYRKLLALPEAEAAWAVPTMWASGIIYER